MWARITLLFSHSSILQKKPVIAAVLPSESSALGPQGFTILQLLVLHRDLSCPVLPFLRHVFSFVRMGCQRLLFSSPLSVFVLQNTGGLVCCYYLLPKLLVPLCVIILPQMLFPSEKSFLTDGPLSFIFKSSGHAGIIC